MIKINNKLKCLIKNSVVITITRKQTINTNTSQRDAVSQIKKDAPRTLAHIHSHWTTRFAAAGISEPRESAQYILAHILQLKKDLYRNFSREINQETEKQIEILCNKRLLKMPVQYITGEWQFRDLTLKMQSPVFIPRPETEALIDFIQDDLTKNAENILEICCGTGAISLSLLKNNPNIEITAVDKSIAACNLTETNAILHELKERLKIINYEISNEKRLQNISQKYDIIVSNPPYVPSNDVFSVQPEIKLYEDLEALDGGPDGLHLIKTILQISKEKLNKKGKLYLEVDPSHPEKISKLLENDTELQLIKTYKDFCNKDRFVKIQKK